MGQLETAATRTWDIRTVSWSFLCFSFNQPGSSTKLYNAVSSSFYCMRLNLLSFFYQDLLLICSPKSLKLAESFCFITRLVFCVPSWALWRKGRLHFSSAEGAALSKQAFSVWSQHKRSLLLTEWKSCSRPSFSPFFKGGMRLIIQIILIKEGNVTIAIACKKPVKSPTS